jgi:hypothetical protein
MISFKKIIPLSGFFAACLLLVAACNPKNESASADIYKVELRKNVTTDNTLNFNEKISKIEYIPLELTGDKASMLDNVLDICVNQEYIFILSTKVGGVFQFSRSGKFIRNIAKQGNGPGETYLIYNIYSDEQAKRIFIVQPNNVLEYSFDGEYIGTKEITRAISLRYQADNYCIAEVGKEYTFPFTYPKLIGMGVFSAKGDTIALKNDFARPDIVPAENSCMKDVICAFSQNSILYSIASNDTIFRLNSKGIKPAFILDRQNSLEYFKEILLPRGKHSLPDNFTIFDYFDTPKSFFLRAFYNDKLHIFSLDKERQKTNAQISSIAYHELGRCDPRLQGIGINIGEGQIPLWGNRYFPDQKILVQYLPAVEIFYLMDKKIINRLPAGLENLTEESNPVLIIYHM